MESKEKKTNVIAFKLLPRKTEETQEEEICPVIEAIAERAAERFTHMAVNFRMQDTLEMISYLGAAQCGGNGKEVVILMKCIFMAAGMREAAKDLEVLDACNEKEPLAYEYFTEAFLETEEMDWFMMERIMKNGFPQENEKLN